MNAVKELLKRRAESLEDHIHSLSNRIEGCQQATSELQTQKCEEMAELLEIKLHLSKMEEKECCKQSCGG
jgi:prefoldin subunit 5